MYKGGTCPEEHKKKKQHVKPSDLVPACYHEGPPALAAELCHTASAKAIIDVTPGSAHWAMEAMRMNIPYVGIGHTQKHCDMMTAKTRSRLLSAAMDSNDRDFYDPKLTEIVQNSSAQKTAQGAAALAGAAKGTTPTPSSGSGAAPGGSAPGGSAPSGSAPSGSASAGKSGAGTGSSDPKKALLERIAKARSEALGKAVAVDIGEDDITEE